MADDASTPSDTPNPTGTTLDPGADPADTSTSTADDPAPASTWPDNWRQQYSEDPKVVKRLERYASPKAALDALFAAQSKISSGELKSALRENATPEELADWRAANGIPAEAKDYAVKLDNGLIIGEADQPLVDAFLAKAHAAHMQPAQVKEALGFYFEQQEQARIAQEERDNDSRALSEDTLRQEFGADYRRNIGIANQLLDGAPKGVKDQLLAGRLADGTPIGNSPDVIRWLVGLSRELNPIGTVVPGSGTNAVQAIESELGTIRKLMGDHKSEYWKGPGAAKMQERYRDLTTALQKGR